MVDSLLSMLVVSLKVNRVEVAYFSPPQAGLFCSHCCHLPDRQNLLRGLQNAKSLAFCSDKNPYNPVKIEGAAPQTIDAEGESLSWQRVMAADSCSKIVIYRGTDFADGLVKEKNERKPKTLNQKP